MQYIQKLRDELETELMHSGMKRFDKEDEDVPEFIHVIESAQDVKKASVIREILNLIPEREHSKILDYYALSRAAEINYDYAGKYFRDGNPRRTIEVEMGRLFEDCIDIILERIEVEEIDKEQYEIRDPVSKIGCYVMVPIEDDIDRHKRMIAEDILHQGKEQWKR